MANKYGITDGQIQGMVNTSSKGVSAEVKTDIIDKIIDSREARNKSITSNRVRKRSLSYLLFLVLYLLFGSTNALSTGPQMKDVGQYSHRLYEDRDEARVVCGDFRVIAFSDYRVGLDSTPPHNKYQEIVRQYFEFTDLKSGNKKMVLFSYPREMIAPRVFKAFDSNDKFLKQEDSYVGDHAFMWICLKGKNDHYLAIGYSNGGNCRGCEWVELINREGKVVDTSEDSQEHFRKTLLNLGLPQIDLDEPGFIHDIKFRQFWLNNKKEKTRNGK
jgi:hypothetical protein